MTEFISYTKVLALTQYKPFKLEALIAEKRFPIPVKDQRGDVVFVKSEVDEWYSKKPKRVRRFKKDG